MTEFDGAPPPVRVEGGSSSPLSPVSAGLPCDPSAPLRSGLIVVVDGDVAGALKKLAKQFVAHVGPALKRHETHLSPGQRRRQQHARSLRRTKTRIARAIARRGEERS